jgi:hypothetical protein
MAWMASTNKPKLTIQTVMKKKCSETQIETQNNRALKKNRKMKQSKLYMILLRLNLSTQMLKIVHYGNWLH